LQRARSDASWGDAISDARRDRRANDFQHTDPNLEMLIDRARIRRATRLRELQGRLAVERIVQVSGTEFPEKPDGLPANSISAMSGASTCRRPSPGAGR